MRSLTKKQEGLGLDFKGPVPSWNSRFLLIWHLVWQFLTRVWTIAKWSIGASLIASAGKGWVATANREYRQEETDQDERNGGAHIQHPIASDAGRARNTRPAEM
jgi:hypothetical protein